MNNTNTVNDAPTNAAPIPASLEDLNCAISNLDRGLDNLIDSISSILSPDRESDDTKDNARPTENSEITVAINNYTIRILQISSKISCINARVEL